MTRCALAIFVTLMACGTTAARTSWEDVGKEAIDATWHDPDRPEATAATDLDLDTSFYNNGLGTYWPPETGGTEDHGIRVYTVRFGVPPGTSTSHYLLGKHRYFPSGASMAKWDAVIVRTREDGVRNTSFGADGYLVVHTDMTDLYDAVYDPAKGRAYFVGTYRSSTGDNDMLVQCVDVTVADSKCNGWGTNSRRGIYWDLGASNDDIAQRVVFDPEEDALFVAGKTDTASGAIIAVAKIHTDTGNFFTAYGVNGQSAFDVSGRTSGRDQNVFAMTLSPATTPGGKMLHLGGQYKSVESDYDGFVMAVNPLTGYGVGDVTPVAYYTSDDAVTAISVLANGKLAFAALGRGTSGSPDLLLGRLDTNHRLDPSFCGSGVCVTDPAGIRDIHPTAIAERPGNRDLVVAMTGREAPSLPPGPLRSYQYLRQYSANGTTLHAGKTLSFPAAPSVIPNALSAGMQVTRSDVLLTGSRYWTTINSGDADITLVRVLASDSIFASQFGGATSD